MCSSLGGLDACGLLDRRPASRELLQRLVRVDCLQRPSNSSPSVRLRWATCRRFCTRAGFTGELGYEIWTTPDYFATLYDELGGRARSGLTHFGGRALSSLRLEKAYGSFNKDFRPDHTPAEAGLDRFVDFDKPDFIGAPRCWRSALPDRSGASW